MSASEIYREFVVRQLATAPRSIAEIAAASMAAGVLPTMDEGRVVHHHSEDGEDARDAHNIGAQYMVYSLSCAPVGMSAEQQRAFTMSIKDGCMDDWPGGERLGYQVLDSIKFRLPVAVKDATK